MSATEILPMLPQSGLRDTTLDQDQVADPTQLTNCPQVDPRASLSGGASDYPLLTSPDNSWQQQTNNNDPAATAVGANSYQRTQQQQQSMTSSVDEGVGGGNSCPAMEADEVKLDMMRENNSLIVATTNLGNSDNNGLSDNNHSNHHTNHVLQNHDSPIFYQNHSVMGVGSGVAGVGPGRSGRFRSLCTMVEQWLWPRGLPSRERYPSTHTETTPTTTTNPLDVRGVEASLDGGMVGVEPGPACPHSHRGALDLCGLVLILVLCLVLILILCFLYPCLIYTNQPESQNQSEAIYTIYNDKGEGRRVCLTSECVKTAASLLEAMDLTAEPCEDFFQFACGTWNKKHVIPEDRSSVSTFEVLADQLQVILKDLLEQPEKPTDMQIANEAKKFYQSCVNLTAIEIEGETPLLGLLDSLGGWPITFTNSSVWRDPPPFEEAVARIRKMINNGILIDVWVGPDDRNSDQHILQVDQPHLGLPSRDYFLKDRSRRDLLAYHQYMTEVSISMGADPDTASDDMWQVVEFEQRVANISIDEADRQDTGQWYNKISVSKLIQLVPTIDWTLFFQTLLTEDFDIETEVVVYSLPYLESFGELLKSESNRTVYNYLMWRVVMEVVPYLPSKFQQSRIEFKRVLFGVLAERNRWNMCVEWTNKKLGMAVGSLFVKDHFNQESKEVALEMIHGIREAFNDLLIENPWMDEETREVARDKANAINERIGYPDYILNNTALTEEYSNITLTNHSFLNNILLLLDMEATKNLRKLGSPVDKERWSTAPAVVNAFYSPNKNDIVFPAGILQPLFYSRHFPKSLNYGGIGVVIGHEITHGFDDKGRQFDKHGNLLQWWNNATIERFREQAQCIVDQYSSYKLDNIDLNINGKMTQGENIADNGGLKQAYRAYMKWVEVHGQEADLPGLNMTHEQLFFLNYAQIWCGSMRPEDAQTKIMSSVHAPGPVRVLGPLSNSREFAGAYKCKPGTRMNPIKKCSVW